MNGEQFLKYDSCIGDQQHILLFASEIILQSTASYFHWPCSHGMLKIEPEQRFQLFRIHVQVECNSFRGFFLTAE